MRGIVYRQRKTRLLALAMGLAAVYFFSFYEPYLLKRFAECGVSKLIPDRLTVRIEDITGGMFRNIIFRNVAFSTGEGGKEKVFRLERVELSRHAWRQILGIGLAGSGTGHSPGHVVIYAAEDNPFVRGFIKLRGYPERVELFGHVAPVVLGQSRKTGVKGVFFKREDGKYDCDVLWGGKLKITGTLDFPGRSIDLRFVPLARDKGASKISASMDDNGVLRAYSRLDRADIFGAEVIGDLRVYYKSSGTPEFSLKAGNLVVNKRPFWDVTVEGGFSPAHDAIFIDKAAWGERVVLTGDAGLRAPYPVNLRLSIDDVELKELGGMLGNGETPLSGTARVDIKAVGPIKTAVVNGRLYIGEGSLGNMEFRSLFATLKGRLPVVRVTDSRAVKAGGHIIIGGEMDFSKLSENKAFDDLVFETDNRVAVWEDWQISKEESVGVVEARKNRMIVSTSMEDSGLWEKVAAEDPAQKELGFRYKIDETGSLKLDIDEERDFLALEHRIRF